MRQGQLQMRFLQSESLRKENRTKLEALSHQILQAVPGCALATDQPYRALDLAIDFCEDVPALGESAIDDIVRVFETAGATCKVSSIHVNGWYGRFDKAEGCARFLKEVFDEDLSEEREHYAFFGDSANDEPLFAQFPNSIGVANVAHFLPRIKTGPRFITQGNGGHGFAEGVAHILRLRDAHP
jgi:3-deoxy-D-manno-octulosonate 8-phosphate phosphatase KdsC-like HAD superfamily phosphatase